MKPKNGDVYLLLFFFAVYNSTWFNDVFGDAYYRLLLLCCSVWFLANGSRRKRVLSGYDPRRITRDAILIFLAVAGFIIAYRLVQIFLFHPAVRPGIVSAAGRPGMLLDIPFLEDLFFIGIVFDTLRLRLSERGLESFLAPFLITFYWFLLPHRYTNDFLDPSFTFMERIRDFPRDILIGFLAGVFVYVRTGSLILAGICHYLFNLFAWWYICIYMPRLA